MIKPQGRVEFTQRQLDWLDQQFPEVKVTKDSSDRDNLWHLARRSVIHELRDRLQKQE